MRCIGKNIVLAVETISGDNVTPGGIIMPEKNKEEDTYKFTVAMIGDEVTKVEVGETILEPEVTIVRHNRQRQGASPFDLVLPDGRDAMVIEESDVRLVIDENE